MDRKLLALMIAAAGMPASGCDLIGPSCLARQDTGVVLSRGGTIEPGQIVSMVVPYETKGTQNNVNVNWNGRLTLGGPRPQFFATSSECQDFVPPPIEQRYLPRGACTVIGHLGGSIAPEARECARLNQCQPIAGEVLVNSLIITGPGNGAPAGFSEYKLFIVGDPSQQAAYTVSVTWFSGPDC